MLRKYIPWHITGPIFIKRAISTQVKPIVAKTTNFLIENGGRFINTGKGFIHGPTGDDVLKGIDLTDKTCLITEGNSGIGLEMTRCLLEHNCNVVMACRNIYSANNVTRNICPDSKKLRIYETNLASLASVKKFTDKINKDEKKIDIVLLNAGVFGLPWTLTDDGLETIFQVNYLSQYYLLMNIEGILAPNVRVVFVSAESHRNVKWPIEIQLSPTEEILSLPKEEYTSIKAYNVSKLCGVSAMHYLGYRWLHTGKSVFCAHPGSFIKTNLCRNWWVYENLYAVMQPFSKTVSQGAATPLYCATSPDLNGLSAQYYKDCQRCDESDVAHDNHLSFRLNDITRMLIKEREKSEVPKLEVKDPIFEDTKPAPSSSVHETLVSNYST